MKIAVIGLKGLPAAGGAASVGEAIIKHLKNKHEFHVYSISLLKDKNLKNDNSEGYQQIFLNTLSTRGYGIFLYYIFSMLHCLFLANYDIIHLHHAESGFITPFLRIKYKVLVTFHGIFNKSDPKYGMFANILFRFSEKLNCGFANKVVSVSQNDVGYLYSKYQRYILHIPNGIYKDMNNKYPVCANDIDFLFVAARIYEIKGLDLLLRAIKKLSLKGKLVVIGDLSQQSTYQKKIISMADGMNVEFMPLIREKSKLYKIIRRAKILIQPSLYEAMSMTLLEAVSLNVPVIISDIKANTDIFDESEVTYFSSGNYSDLGNKIQYAINNEAEIKKKAELALKKVKEKLLWSKIAEDYDKLFIEMR